LRLEEACIPTFARHETFHPRYGWLKKAYDGALEDPAVFTHDQATVRLGVGKNMVRAIRFWGHAARILAPVENPAGGRTMLSAPSRIGRAIFDDHGWDPYCEDPATLWLVHWLLLAPPCQLPAWWAVFHDLTALEFTDDGVHQFAEDHINANPTWTPPHPSSIAKDISCMLRTYVQASGERASIDDLLDCPMRDLGLLRLTSSSPRTYRFSTGPKPTLPPAIVLYASLDFLARTDQGAQTATVSRLATEPGGPGRSFRLNEQALAAAMELAAVDQASVEMAAPNGVAQLSFKGNVAAVASEVLHAYYEGRTGVAKDMGLTAGPEADAAVDLALVDGGSTT
jgi:hypothetical protein